MSDFVWKIDARGGFFQVVEVMRCPLFDDPLVGSIKAVLPFWIHRNGGSNVVDIASIRTNKKILYKPWVRARECVGSFVKCQVAESVARFSTILHFFVGSIKAVPPFWVHRNGESNMVDVALTRTNKRGFMWRINARAVWPFCVHRNDEGNVAATALLEPTQETSGNDRGLACERRVGSFPVSSQLQLAHVGSIKAVLPFWVRRNGESNVAATAFNRTNMRDFKLSLFDGPLVGSNKAVHPFWIHRNADNKVAGVALIRTNKKVSYKQSMMQCWILSSVKSRQKNCMHGVFQRPSC